MNKIVTTIGALFLTAAPSFAEVEELTLRYAIHAPQGTAITESDEYFAERVAELSGGRVKVDLYWNRALGQQKEMLPLIEAGVVDLSTLETGQYGETPLVGIGNSLPMTYFDAETVLKVSRDLYENSAPIKEEMDRIGARMLYVRHLPNYQIICSEPIRTMDDFKGKKMRAYGAYVPVMWQSVDAIPVNVTAQEIYDGLAKGVIDCAYLPAPFMNILKFYEPAPYLIDLKLGMIEFAPTLVPNVVWDSWSDEMKSIMLQAAAETEAWAIGHTEADNQNQIDQMVEKGATIVEFEEKDAFSAAVPNMHEQWLERQKEQGRAEEGQAIVDQINALLADS